MEPNRRCRVAQMREGHAIMKHEYFGRARDCVRIAQQSTDPLHRVSLLEMAQAWMLLHDQAERNSQADITYEPPPLRASDLKHGRAR
jgi:hypothetical protein